jgi:hypothetical protein
MPSIVIGGQSGGHPLWISGNNPWSGVQRGPFPTGGIQFRYGVATANASFYSGNLSGLVYIALSGPMTTTSGALPLSGAASSGLLDGVPLAAGDSYFLPRLATGGTSGQISSGGLYSGVTPPFNVWFTCDANVSGIARVAFEIF